MRQRRAVPSVSRLAPVICAWLRNDLRTHDSGVLQRAAELAQKRELHTVPVYVFDPRQFRRTKRGALQTGPFRALFLLQSVQVLRKRLRDLGSDLLVRVGHPEKILPALLPEGSVLLTQEEVTSEELKVDTALRSSLGDRVDWEYIWGSTLFHRADLPFRGDLHDAPDTFTTFKNKVEPEMAAKVNEVPESFRGERKTQSEMKVRPLLPDLEKHALPFAPDLEDTHPDLSWNIIPYADDIPEPQVPDEAALQFQGGEDEGLKRLQYYLFDTDLVATYFERRNKMLGGDYSTKLAPWLSLGCVSPRKVFEQIREYERTRAASKSTYWVIFELMWRDFYRFFAAKHGDRIFQLGGVRGEPKKWTSDDETFKLWTQGRTGYPLIDANMRELKATGFMSNRGRQNVASFLVNDMRVDWRLGASHFEELLVDYDVASNWGNWVALAGLVGGRLNRFNVVAQGKVYDGNGAYVRHWLPELRSVPVKFIQQPWLMSAHERQDYNATEYPAPCVDPANFKDKYRSDGKRIKSR